MDSPVSESRRRVAWALLGLLAAAAGWALFRYDPGSVGFLPACPFHSLTGLNCPGCGTMRGIHRLLHGDLAGAVSMNALMVASIPLLAWYGASGLRTSRGRPPLPGCRTLGARPWLIFGVIVLYTVLRNIPAEPFSRLAPG